ncbi:large ribosomal subunit protein eL20z isoform X2 [Solanum lycopersicum]|uniref:large ribosomal subunit protein eL20z isoform X2 n=1 Tax=Solanum lycopersicum TaxID=4081 RepID=UPI00374A1E39
MSEGGKDSHYHHHGHHYDHHHHYYGHHHHHQEKTQPPPPWLPTAPPEVAEYGTFQPPPQPVIGFPLPVPPPGSVLEPSEYYARGYHSVPGYVIDERRPVTEPRLPFGIGLGWFLFIIGFFLAGFPWYVAAFIPLCNRSIDHREKSGFVACTIAAVLAVIGNIVFGLTWILLTA